MREIHGRLLMGDGWHDPVHVFEPNRDGAGRAQPDAAAPAGTGAGRAIVL